MSNKVDFNNVNDYSLSVRICSDGFFLTVSDENGTMLLNRFVSAPVFSLSCQEIIDLFEQEGAIMSSDYSEVKLIVEGDHYVFVPEAVFDIQETDTYFGFQHKPNKQHVVLFNRIHEWDTVNVFSIPLTLNEALDDLFADSTIEHHLSVLLTEKIKPQGNSVSVWVRSRKMDVVAIKSGKLILLNSFEYRTVEDFTYFVLNVFEQLELNTNVTKVKLFQRDKKDHFRSLISEYVRDCEVILQ